MDKLILPPVSDTAIAFRRMLSVGHYDTAVNILLLSGFAVQFYSACNAQKLDKVISDIRAMIVQITQRYAPSQPLQCAPNSAVQQVDYLTERVMRLIEKNRRLEQQIVDMRRTKYSSWRQRFITTKH